MQMLIGHGQVPTIMPEASNILVKMRMQEKGWILFDCFPCSPFYLQETSYAGDPSA